MVKPLVVAILLAFAAPARAEPSRLDEARAAIEQVRYDRARTLLLAALEAGGNSPRELAEIYRLSAVTATVLGDAALAESYYRRWLALEPDADLPSDLAPKLRRPFEAVRADMAHRGKLVVITRAVAGGVEVRVASDPMQMAVAATLDGKRAAIAGGAAHLTVPPNARSARVTVLDESGNTVAEIEVALPPASEPPANAPASEPSALVAPAAIRPPTPERPWTRRATTWAIGAAGLAVLGIVFANAASPETTVIVDGMIVDLNGSDTYSTLATISFIGAGACAITALVFATSRPAAKTVVAPTVSATTVGATLVTRW